MTEEKKDNVPEIPEEHLSLFIEILRFLANNTDKFISYGTLTKESVYSLSVQDVFPVGTLKEDQLKFMKNIIKLGYVEDAGCLPGMCEYVCHCPFDFSITDKGLDILIELFLNDLDFNDGV